MKYFILSITLTVILLPFVVFPQNVAIEHEKMNIFYIGVENPVTVAVENCPCNKVVVKSDIGRLILSKDSCHYNYYVSDSYGKPFEQIYVGIKDNEKIKWIDTLKYRIKNIPNPEIYITGLKDGQIDKNMFSDSGTIVSHSINLQSITLFNFEYYLNVIKYSVKITRNDSVIYKEAEIPGNKFTKGLLSEIKKAQTNDKYIFFNVIVIGSDKREIIIEKSFNIL